MRHFSYVVDVAYYSRVAFQIERFSPSDSDSLDSIRHGNGHTQRLAPLYFDGEEKLATLSALSFGWIIGIVFLRTLHTLLLLLLFPFAHSRGGRRRENSSLASLALSSPRVVSDAKYVVRRKTAICRLAVCVLDGTFFCTVSATHFPRRDSRAICSPCDLCGLISASVGRSDSSVSSSSPSSTSTGRCDLSSLLCAALLAPATHRNERRTVRSQVVGIELLLDDDGSTRGDEIFIRFSPRAYRMHTKACVLWPACLYERHTPHNTHEPK